MNAFENKSYLKDFGLSLFFIVLLVFSSCRTVQEVEIRERMDDGYYQNHVQSDLVRQQIKESFNTVRRIQSNVSYRTYQFYVDDMPFESQLQDVDFAEVAAESSVDNHSTAGTAIVLSQQRGRVALLSAAHTVSFPDTIWHYGDGISVAGDQQVEAVSVRENINQFVFTDDGIEMLEFILADPRRDLAVMRSQASIGSDANLMPLNLTIGNFEQLDWSDMVYAMGYPRGVKMVTQGTASRSEHPIRRLVMDISINRGFSGGAVFAVRSDGSGLEWVGMITSAMGEQETYLAPEVQHDDEYNPDLPYEGTVYVRTASRIHYGITNAVDVDQIRDFLSENLDELRARGVSVPDI
ncbi:MAG: trypsin-like peptidase domain-containing protein [Balneolaceae bacterium]|nr:trypsin-like peptidase domain-containing protein [Balneolaceae bacterium]